MAGRNHGATGNSVLLPPAVEGLAAGRKVAQHRHRRRRLRTAISRTIGLAVVMGAVGGAGYVGYEVWLAEDGWDTDGEQRQVSEEELRGVIDDLEDNPRWNGPGNPTFGVGDAPEAELLTTP